MESVIIEEMRAFLRLDLPDRQRQYFTDTIAVAKRVEVVKAADVFDEREIELIRRTVRPAVKECYKNAHLLTSLFPDRVRYVEGKTHTVIPIDHAFNRVGDKYIDITFEFALELDPTQYEYVAFGEYPAGVIEEITDQTGYYGNIYRFCYCAAQMALEKMNPGRNRYAGGSVRSNRKRFLVMRYCKGRLKIGYFTHPAKMISQNKDCIFGN